MILKRDFFIEADSLGVSKNCRLFYALLYKLEIATSVFVICIGITLLAEYIRNQLQEDLAYEQMSIKELVYPFTGEPVKASKK